MKLYLDMDGVLVDFDKGLQNHYATEPDDPHPLEDDERAKLFWNKDCVDFAMFEDMPEIQNFIIGVLPELPTGDLTILTSTGGGEHHMNIAQQKAFWLSEREILKDLPVIFCKGTDNKVSFASPGDVLIDDRTKILEPWANAGGISIHWDGSVASVMRQLEAARVL